MASLQQLLQANCERLIEQYNARLNDVLVLQRTLIEDILPSTTVELGLDDCTVAWIREWLEDTGMSTTTSLSPFTSKG
jgi:hypothetical protein